MLMLHLVRAVLPVVALLKRRGKAWSAIARRGAWAVVTAMHAVLGPV